MKTNYNLLLRDYRHGYEAASEDLLDPRYDLGEALASFRRDPADSLSQEGYLQRLLDENERREQAIADKYEHEQRMKYLDDFIQAQYLLANRKGE